MLIAATHPLDVVSAQPSAVMDADQRLRKKAKDAGRLRSTDPQKVAVERRTIVVEPAQADAVYVPAGR